MSWSKDPNTGKPTFVPESMADKVSLYSVDDVKQPANAMLGIKTPGWVFHDSHARANGQTRKRTETLVSFRGFRGETDPVFPPILRDAGTASVGLNGIQDWSSSYPFIDVFKTARKWVGHTEEEWGSIPFESMSKDANGWVTQMPANATAIETFILTGLPSEMILAAGTYRVTWEGDGTLNMSGNVSNITTIDTHTLTFDYTPLGDDLLVVIAISAINPANYIRNIRVIKTDHIELYAQGEIFNPDWLDIIKGFRCLRFMDWQGTNWSTKSSWNDMPSVDYFSWTGADAPLEVMVRLANTLEADAWFNIPHLADDNFVINFATYVRDNLNRNLTAYYEFSNEIWNFTFSGASGQSSWAIDLANSVLPGVGDGWMQIAGVYAAKTMRTITQVYGSRTNFKRVIATQTEWEGLEHGLLNAEDYRLAFPETPAPYTAFDCYAVTGYFNGELSDAEFMPTVQGWLENGLQSAITNAIDNIRNSTNGRSVATLFDYWDYQKNVCDTYGLDLLMYEGGTHTIPPEPIREDEDILAFFEALNYSTEMADVYRDVMDRWELIGGISFNVFVEITNPGVHGYWGALRYLGDSNPRWNAIQERVLSS